MKKTYETPVVEIIGMVDDVMLVSVPDYRENIFGSQGGDI